MNDRVTRQAQDDAVGVITGTRANFFSSVFFVMGIGLALTGAIAVYLSQDANTMSTLFHLVEYTNSNGELKQTFAASWWWYGALIVELSMVIFLSWFGYASRLSTGVALTVFTAYAALNGLTLAPVLYAYTTASILRVFFIASAMFGGCALWGVTTKRDLTGYGSFFLSALVGLLIALILGMFFQSPVYDMGVSAIAVLLFAGLIAHDMQILEKIYAESGGTYSAGLVVTGALALYLDFINMFLHLLRLFGIKVND